jgi:hypothetical protein
VYGILRMNADKAAAYQWQMIEYINRGWKSGKPEDKGRALGIDGGLLGPLVVFSYSDRESLVDILDVGKDAIKDFNKIDDRYCFTGVGDARYFVETQIILARRKGDEEALKAAEKYLFSRDF